MKRLAVFGLLLACRSLRCAATSAGRHRAATAGRCGSAAPTGSAAIPATADVLRRALQGHDVTDRIDPDDR